MGNQPSGNSSKKASQKKMKNAFSNNLIRSGKIPVSPYVGQSQNLPVQMQRSKSPIMDPQNLAKSSFIPNAINRTERLDRPPMIQSTSNPNTSMRRVSPTRDTPDSRNDNLTQALARALGTDNRDYSGYSTRRDNSDTLFNSRRGGSRDTSPEMREPSMLLSRNFRDYTPPRTNENSFTSTRLNERSSSNEENRFTEKEVAKLKLDFALISKSGNILSNKLIEYLGLEEIEMSPFVERLFSTLQKNFEGRGRTGYGGTFSFGYDNFVGLVAILCKGTANERLDLIYKIFDPRGQGYIFKEDFYDVYSLFFHTMMSVNFRQPVLSQLREQLLSFDENELNDIIVEFVEDIYATATSNPDRMQQNEWKRWFNSQPGMQDVLTMKIDLIVN